MKIAILGCGYAGLSAALAFKNHEVVLFEQSSKLLPVGAGILLQPLGLQVLKAYGLEEKALSIGDQILGLFGVNDKDKPILDLRYKKYAPNLFGTGIHRGHLFLTMADALTEQVSIRLGERVEKVFFQGDKCRFISNEVLYEDFDLVVISNGAKSTFRSVLPGFKYQREYPWGAFWGIFKNYEFDKTTLYQRYRGTKELLGLLPCGINPSTKEDLINLFWSARKDDLREIMDDGIDVFNEKLISFEPLSERVIQQIHSFDDLVYTTYQDVFCKHWHFGNAVFIGDTIHGMSPQLGIGLNMALYDGYLLGEVVNQPRFNLQHLGYLKKYRSNQNLYYHLTCQLLTRFFQSDFSLLGNFRDLIFPVFPKIPWLDRLMIDSLCGYKTGLVHSSTPEQQMANFISWLADR